MARWGRLAVFTMLVAGLVPGVSGAAESCSLLTDPAADVSRPVDEAGPPQQKVDLFRLSINVPSRTRRVDRATDLREVKASYQGGILSFEAHVQDLTHRLPDDTHHQLWIFDWTIDGIHYQATVYRDRSGFMSGWSGDTVPDASPAATIDTTRDLIRIDAYAEYLQGQRITDISAHARNETPGNVVTQSDDAPQNATDAATYLPGVSCEDQTAQVCPVVVDTKGDAGPFRAFDGRTIPADQPSLDIISAGAESSDEMLALSIRMLDLRAPNPAGYDTVGWTASWRSTQGYRVIAQARRTGTLTKFTYALDPKPDQAPSGPVFGGRSTTGSVDLDTGLITIVVPRDIAGDVLPRFAASSWVMRSAVTAQPYLVVDKTPMGRYRTGTACSA